MVAKLIEGHSGVISRGAQGGGAPLVKILDHIGGAQPPLEILAMLNYALLRGY